MKPLKLAVNPDFKLAPTALRRAAAAARLEAERTNSYIVVLEKGKIVRKRPKAARQTIAKAARAR